MWIVDYLRTASTSNRWGLRVANVGEVVASRVYRGARPSVKALAELPARLGIRTMLCLLDADGGKQARRAADERAAAEALGLRFLWRPFDDKSAPDPAAVHATAAVLAEPSVWPVYLHCEGGRHRTGGVVAAYRIEVDRWSNEQAYEEAKRFGLYGALGHEGWVRLVKTYTSAPAAREKETTE